MSISTYSELQTAVASWANRSDLTALIPDFITLAEERMNRALRVKEMETALSETAISDAAVAVPANTVGVKTLWIVGYEDSPLVSRTYDQLLSQGTDGTPTGWAWQGDNFYFDGSGSVEGVLYRNIPALSTDNTTNWLLTKHPSLYLAGALVEAFEYIEDERRRNRWNERFLATVDSIQGGDMRDRLSGPLTVVVR
jgi:nitroreductase